MLDLEPDRLLLGGYGWKEENAELYVYVGFCEAMRRTCERLLLEDGTTVERVIAALEECIRTEDVAAIEVALANEQYLAEMLPDHEQPVTQLTDGQRIMTGCIPEPYREKIRAFVRMHDKGIAALTAITQDPALDIVRALIREVAKQLLPTKGTGDIAAVKTGIDPIYHRIKSCIGNPEYTLPLGDIHKLVFLAFLSRDVRCAVQECLIHNTLAEGMKGNSKIVTLARDYMHTRVLAHSHWSELVEAFGASEAIQIELISAQLAAVEAAERIRDYQRVRTVDAQETAEWAGLVKFARDPHHTQISDGMLRHHQGLPMLLGPAEFGHCFDPIWLMRDLESALTHHDRKLQKKDGRRAVIFEDSPEQMESYRRRLEQHSPLTLLAGDSSRCTTLDAVMAVADQAEYFLLDIQNREDMDAGIRAAETLLHHHYKKIQPEQPQPAQKITIVVWSASHERVKEAGQRLGRVILELDPDRKFITFQANSALQKEYFTVDVRTKYQCLYF